MILEKRCITCKEIKQECDFDKNRRSCRMCRAALRRENYKNNRDKILKKNLSWKKANSLEHEKSLRNSRYLYRYGITTEEYESLFKTQNGQCKICKSTDFGRKNANHFCVDHCHITGKVRGLLCHKCNSALGKFNDDINLLKNAITYLEA